MTPTPAVPLAEQRRLLREQLGAQRVRLAGQLARGGAHGGYPRSVTMRWLIREPELVTKLMEGIVGARVASHVPAALVIVRFLRSATAS